MLHHVSLGNYPAYETISYAWGDRNDRGAMDIDGQNMEIPRSASEALRQVRLPGRRCWLWLDAACINQANLQ